MQPFKKKPTNMYITNDQIYPPLAEYIKEYRIVKAINEAKDEDETPDEYPRVPDAVGRAVLLIAERLATKPNFSGYSYIQDMIGDGYENCIRYIHNFDPDKSKNPFSYITLIIHRAFVRRIQKEKTHSYIRHKLVLSNSDIIDMMGAEAASVGEVGSVNLTKSSEVVTKYEDSLAEKKRKAKARKEAK